MKKTLPLGKLSALSFLFLLLGKVLFETSFNSFQCNTKDSGLSNYSIKLILCSHYCSSYELLCQNKSMDLAIYKGRLLLCRNKKIPEVSLAFFNHPFKNGCNFSRQ